LRSERPAGFRRLDVREAFSSSFLLKGAYPHVTPA
jgi:hypothetical protein